MDKTMNSLRTFVSGLVLGLLIGWPAGWLGQAKWAGPSPENERAALQGERASEAAAMALLHANEALKAKAQALNLQPERIRAELAQTGQVVRRQAVEISAPIADAAAEAATTVRINAALAADPNLSVFDISVTTNADQVTLEGGVASEDQVAQAIIIAMETEGVERVISKLKVRPQ